LESEHGATSDSQELPKRKMGIQVGWQGRNDFHEQQSPGTTVSEYNNIRKVVKDP